MWAASESGAALLRGSQGDTVQSAAAPHAVPRSPCALAALAEAVFNYRHADWPEVIGRAYVRYAPVKRWNPPPIRPSPSRSGPRPREPLRRGHTLRGRWKALPGRK
jgi:hypothetical protein